MSTNEKETSSKRARHRSPAYPGVNLEEAIAKVAVVFQQDKRAYTSSDAILSHLGFKGSGGSSRRIVSAMRQFGLLDEETGRYRVSEAAFRLIHLSEASPERAKLIREAALTPPIIGRIVDFFNGELPSDATLKEHLIIKEKFNPDSVDLFIRVLRETLAFAKIPSVYSSEAPQSGQSEEIVMSGSMSSTPNADWTASFGKKDTQPANVPSSGQLPFPLYLSKTQKATLQVPASMTRKEFDLLKKQIANSLDVMEATILSDSVDSGSEA